MTSNCCQVNEERNRVLGREHSMSRNRGMHDMRSSIQFNMIGTRGVGVAGVDTEEVDKSEILKILEYWAKESESDKKP